MPPYQGQIDCVVAGRVDATMVQEDVWLKTPANADATTATGPEGRDRSCCRMHDRHDECYRQVSRDRKKTTTRQRAKKQVNPEVASEACMQASGANPSRKRLEDKPLEALRFSAGF